MKLFHYPSLSVFAVGFIGLRFVAKGGSFSLCSCCSLLGVLQSTYDSCLLTLPLGLFSVLFCLCPRRNRSL